jgi:hypothetical protein
VPDELVVVWPSLAGQLDFIEQFFGAAGRVEAAESLRQSLTAEVDSAAQREAHRRYVVSEAVPADYGPRAVVTPRGSVFGQIHDQRGNIAGPFVDVVAHSFEDLDELRSAVAYGWSVFSPRFLRLRARPGEHRGPDSRVLRTLYAARCVDMVNPDGRVELSRFKTVDEAMVLAPEWGDCEIEHWQESGHLWAIRSGGKVVGALAISPSAGAGAPCYAVEEKFVVPEHRGNGYSAAAQAVWAKTMASSEPTAVLLGSIDPDNLASVRSAIRAGRRAVIDTVLVGLEEVTGDNRRQLGGAISEPYRGRHVSRPEECAQLVANNAPTT